ncbi:MAG: hypothetical protein AAF716_23615 [Cyanobacteria bacterium P01_D01_bin.1]
MTIPFQEFRDRYPEGALVADLISIYDGQYVVRASVVLTGEAIATGLAADQSVEAAEDKARDRALAILGLSANGQPLNTQKVDSIARTSTAEMAEESIEALPTPIQPLPLPDVGEEPAIEEPTIEEPEEDLGPPIDVVVEQSPPAIQKPSAAAIALENFNTSALPVDLSDVIAQTDVELRRLGWTSVQGQEYLEKTYGKRSRRQLTDDELMSFLLYLEEQ